MSSRITLIFFADLTAALGEVLQLVESTGGTVPVVDADIVVKPASLRSGPRRAGGSFVFSIVYSVWGLFCIFFRPLVGMWVFMDAVFTGRCLSVSLAILVADRFVVGLFIVFHRFFSFLFPFTSRNYAGEDRCFRRSVIRSIVPLGGRVYYVEGRSGFFWFSQWLISLFSAL